VIFGLLALACASGASATTWGHADARRLAIVVTPSRGLHDDQVVTVRVTGFGSGVKVFLSECASVVDAGVYGCGVQLAAQPFLTTSASGTGTGLFRVRSIASPRPYSTLNEKRCGDSCVLVATVGFNTNYGVVAVAALRSA